MERDFLKKLLMINNATSVSGQPIQCPFYQSVFVAAFTLSKEAANRYLHIKTYTAIKIKVVHKFYFRVILENLPKLLI